MSPIVTSAFTFEKNAVYFCSAWKLHKRWPETSNGRRLHHLSLHGVKGAGIGDTGRRRGWRIMSRFCPVPIAAPLLLPGSRADADVDNGRLSVFSSFSFFLMQNVGVLRGRCLVFHSRCVFFIYLYFCYFYFVHIAASGMSLVSPFYYGRKWLFPMTLRRAQTLLSPGVLW